MSKRQCTRCDKNVPSWFGTEEVLIFVDEGIKTIFRCAKCGEEQMPAYPSFWNRLIVHYRVYIKHRQIRKLLLASSLPKMSRDEVESYLKTHHSPEDAKTLYDLYGYKKRQKKNIV